MKKLLPVLALVIGLQTVSALVAVDNTKSESSKTLPNIVGGATFLGALASFMFWLPGTVGAVQQYGVMGAIGTTHIPRLSIDLLTMATGIYLLYEVNKSKSKESDTQQLFDAYQARKRSPSASEELKALKKTRLDELKKKHRQ
jgi:H+/gluconate symporter-like permease